VQLIIRKRGRQMKKLSIRQKAYQASGLSRACNKCPLKLLFNPDTQGHVCGRCYDSFIEGYAKGYKQAKKGFIKSLTAL